MALVLGNSVCGAVQAKKNIILGYITTVFVYFFVSIKSHTIRQKKGWEKGIKHKKAGFFTISIFVKKRRKCMETKCRWKVILWLCSILRKK